MTMTEPDPALILLATLFGLAVAASTEGGGMEIERIASAVRLLTRGITPAG